MGEAERPVRDEMPSMTTARGAPTSNYTPPSVWDFDEFTSLISCTSSYATIDITASLQLHHPNKFSTETSTLTLPKIPFFAEKNKRFFRDYSDMVLLLVDVSLDMLLQLSRTLECLLAVLVATVVTRGEGGGNGSGCKWSRS